MFETTVKNALRVPLPGRDWLHIVGINTKGNIRIGEFITDGEMNYEITAMPMICRKEITKQILDEMDICISTNKNADDFLGKILYAV